MLNCKQGDLAVVVRSKCGNAGRIVEVLMPLGIEPLFAGLVWDSGASRGAFCWLVRALGQPLQTFSHGTWVELPMPDSVMRPLRDSDGEDESLRLVGKPMDSLVGA